MTPSRCRTATGARTCGPEREPREAPRPSPAQGRPRALNGLVRARHSVWGRGRGCCWWFFTVLAVLRSPDKPGAGLWDMCSDGCVVGTGEMPGSPWVELLGGMDGAGAGGSLARCWVLVQTPGRQ